MSKKFTGITSAGSAIPVYDKDAHTLYLVSLLLLMMLLLQ